ncbi:alpha/beta hydrolase family protein [Chitinophagaceae bacterium LWZ2-11]
MRKLIFFLLIVCSTASMAQKKPLDHTVYDGWQNIGERYISNNGKFIVYTVTPQEGDATLVVQQPDGKKLIEVPRGYNAKITEDNRFVIFKIKPTLQQIKSEAKGGKKPAAPAAGRGGARNAEAGGSSTVGQFKDSLGIVDLSTLKLEKTARVKSFKIPEKASGWVVYLLEKPADDSRGPRPDRDSTARLKAMTAMADSLSKVVDSLRNKVTEAETKGMAVLQSKREPHATAKPDEAPFEEGTDLVILNLNTGKKETIKLVSEYVLSKKGNSLVIETTKKTGDAHVVPVVVKLDLATNKADTVLRVFNDAKSYAFDEEGNQLAFVAERDSAKKESQKFFKLYYYKEGLDSAKLLADRTSKGVPAKWSISEFGAISFSKSGKRLFFATAPVLPPKDTTLPEAERVSVDIWNYHDDDLMTVQLKNLETNLKRSFLARYDFDNNGVIQLADEKFERVMMTSEGDGNVFYTTSDFGKRVQQQWQGFTLQDFYTVNPITGERKLIIKDIKGRPSASYSGKYLTWFDNKKKTFSVYNNATKNIYVIGADIKEPLYDVENDVPEEPGAYGIAGWTKDDKDLLITAQSNIWKVSPDNTQKSSIVNVPAQVGKLTYRYVKVDEEEKFIDLDKFIYFKIFNEGTKINTYDRMKPGVLTSVEHLVVNSNTISTYFAKAQDADEYLFSRESYSQSPDLYTTGGKGAEGAVKLSNLNPQQSDYSWGTAELFKWKAYTGKETEGVLYKPDNFDAKKKYPMIVYYYERNSFSLNYYQAPAPTPSRLNIPFFVSRGYVVFVPDIWYKTGHPGKSSYDYVISGTRALIKEGFIDSTKLGLQGQSWGGYQTAYLITQTNLFAAAWAGAPVVNMFSAYGGIRWESGSNRQMQYEKGQSRIGSTIWEKPELYVENSPLYHLPKVKTPLVIMSNDADGAVPWYQGIEFFTDMRRLNKQVWLLNYNGEQHNLVERRNRKDIQIREQQFFDWLLKGDKPAKWLTEGVPAVMKGRDLGLGVD